MNVPNLVSRASKISAISANFFSNFSVSSEGATELSSDGHVETSDPVRKCPENTFFLISSKEKLTEKIPCNT